MRKRIIAALIAGFLGGAIAVPVWFYGRFKEAKHITNPYGGNIYVHILLGVSIGVMIVIFWFMSEEENKR